jgi:hypothetical protein
MTASDATHDGIDVTLPDGETPAAECPYCGRPFQTERLRALHVGERHPEECTDDERAEFEAAREAESDDLFIYHLKVIAALVVLFFVFVYAYAFVWTG